MSQILESMQIVRNICSEGLRQRRDAGIKVRQPLRRLTITEPQALEILHPPFLKLIAEELNVHEVAIPVQTQKAEGFVVWVDSLGFSGYDEGLYLE